jgi:hypothetical protein
MAVFDLRAEQGMVDADTARALLHGLVRSVRLHEVGLCVQVKVSLTHKLETAWSQPLTLPLDPAYKVISCLQAFAFSNCNMCRYDQGLQVADYLKSRGLKMKLRDFTSIITAFSQRSNPMDALDLLTAIEHNVAYESKAIHNYHFHFAKLIVQEFLEEALQTLDRAANAPAFGLQENGLAAMDVVIHSSHNGQKLTLNVPALGSELQRGLMVGRGTSSIQLTHSARKRLVSTLDPMK